MFDRTKTLCLITALRSGKHNGTISIIVHESSICTLRDVTREHYHSILHICYRYVGGSPHPCHSYDILRLTASSLRGIESSL